MKITVKEASERLGVSQEVVRALLREEKVSWGVARRKSEHSNYQYIIFPKEFERVVG